jgi:hypothetical protein
MRRGGHKRRGKVSETLTGLAGLAMLVAGVWVLQAGYVDVGPDRVQGWLLGTDLVGQVTYVRDGDTIEVSGTPIRIANLDCAERGDSGGPAATARMMELVAGQEVVCRLTGRQSYDRKIGHCRLVGGDDLGRILIGEGICDRWR